MSYCLIDWMAQQKLVQNDGEPLNSIDVELKLIIFV